MITLITVISGWDQLSSDFSWWLNLGHNISLGTLIFIFAAVAITIIILESSSTTYFKPLILTSKVQYKRAKYNIVEKMKSLCVNFFASFYLELANMHYFSKFLPMLHHGSLVCLHGIIKGLPCTLLNWVLTFGLV